MTFEILYPSVSKSSNVLKLLAAVKKQLESTVVESQIKKCCMTTDFVVPLGFVHVLDKMPVEGSVMVKSQGWARYELLSEFVFVGMRVVDLAATSVNRRNSEVEG